jgi:hypothetical protein
MTARIHERRWASGVAFIVGLISLRSIVAVGFLI